MNKEIVLIIGINAAGKSTLVQEFVDKGYERFNRDNVGGSLDRLHEMVDSYLNGSKKQVVLDNTYPSVESRKPIIAVAKKHNIPIRCIWLTTSLEDAQLNACLRMIRKYGKLLMPEDFKIVKDPNAFPPAALFAYRKAFEEPTKKEGFVEVTDVPFIRKWDNRYNNKAVILDYDGTLRVSTGKKQFPMCPSEIQILPNRTKVLKQWAARGYSLFGASNQSECAKGLPIQMANECFLVTNRMLGLNIMTMFCPHRIPPLTCYCRKPSVGIGAFFIETYKLDPAQCVMVGDQTSDKTFSERCGFQYKDQGEFFA